MKIDFGNGITGEVEQDHDPLNPRKEWDNLGTMVCKHSRYNLGDTDEIVDSYEDCIILPLYLYDHSGITISTSPFSCPWDSGQVGIIWVKKGTEGMSDEELTAALESEVETYDDYLTGNCWGYSIEDSSGEILDSCWGYLGDEEYCISEMKAAGKGYSEKVAADTAFTHYQETYGE
jgi:hypothetical protein